VVVGLDPLDAGLAVEPGDRVDARPSVGHAPVDAVTEPAGAAVDDGRPLPPVVEALGRVGPAVLERADLDDVAELDVHGTPSPCRRPGACRGRAPRAAARPWRRGPRAPRRARTRGTHVRRAPRRWPERSAPRVVSICPRTCSARARRCDGEAVFRVRSYGSSTRSGSTSPWSAERMNHRSHERSTAHRAPRNSGDVYRSRAGAACRSLDFTQPTSPMRMGPSPDGTGGLRQRVSWVVGPYRASSRIRRGRVVPKLWRRSGSDPLRMPRRPACSAGPCHRLVQGSPHGCPICRSTWASDRPAIHRPIWRCTDPREDRGLLARSGDEGVRCPRGPGTGTMVLA